jgi:hypothetical protein
MLSQKVNNELDSMQIQLNRYLLQFPVCSQYLPPALSTSRLLQMLQLKHLYCLLHNKKIPPLPTVHRKGEGSATATATATAAATATATAAAAAAAAAVELQHNVPARTDRCREPKYFDSGNDICQSDCGKAGEEKTEE